MKDKSLQREKILERIRQKSIARAQDKQAAKTIPIIQQVPAIELPQQKHKENKPPIKFEEPIVSGKTLANYFPIKDNIRKLKIGIFIDHGAIPKSANDCVSTESRMPMNWAILLSNMGHEVDVITENILFPKTENINSILWSNVKSKYDILMYNKDVLPEPQSIQAHAYFILCMFPLNKEYYPEPEIVKLSEEKQVRFCFEWPWLRTISSPNVFFLDKLYCDLPYPVVSLKRTNNFNSTHMFWSSKHNNLIREIDIAGGIINILNIFLSTYPKRFSLTTISGLGEDISLKIITERAFSSVNYAGIMPYTTLIEQCATSKLALGVRYVGSFIEAILNGCIPLIWKQEENDDYKGGVSFIDKAKELGCALSLHQVDVSNQGIHIINTINKLITDETYYNKVYNEFYELAKVHIPENAYAQFCNVVRTLKD